MGGIFAAAKHSPISKAVGFDKKFEAERKRVLGKDDDKPVATPTSETSPKLKKKAKTEPVIGVL